MNGALKTAPPNISESGGPRTEVRCAVRFPLVLPVDLSTSSGKSPAVTCNVSASGVLLATEMPYELGSPIEFSLRMPAAVLGTSRDVLVDCHGRVVRCYPSPPGYHTAATIDEYSFNQE